MAILSIDTSDTVSIREIQEMIVRKFHVNAKIVDGKTDNNNKTKWAEFAEKMDGLFTPKIIEHIDRSKKEARDNFIASI